jgi:hypothetical protein
MRVVNVKGSMGGMSDFAFSHSRPSDKGSSDKGKYLLCSALRTLRDSGIPQVGNSGWQLDLSV